MEMYDSAIPDGALAAAVLLHPHPDYGGDRHNLVVGALYRGLPAERIAAVRFDFGSGDVALAAAAAVAAIDHTAREVPGVPLVLAGYSFGADVAASVTDERLAGWFLAAPPLRFAPATVADDPRPKAIVVAEHDQVSSPDRVRELTAGWTASSLETVPGADHFLVGRTDRVVAACIRFVASLTGAGP